MQESNSLIYWKKIHLNETVQCNVIDITTDAVCKYSAQSVCSDSCISVSVSRRHIAVASHVLTQCRRVAKRHATTFARIRPRTTMGSKMSLKVAGLTKSFTTLRALVRPLARMGQNMTPEIPRLWKNPLANPAGVLAPRDYGKKFGRFVNSAEVLYKSIGRITGLATFSAVPAIRRGLLFYVWANVDTDLWHRWEGCLTLVTCKLSRRWWRPGLSMHHCDVVPQACRVCKLLVTLLTHRETF